MKNSEFVKFAIQNIITEGLTDIFPRPFEVDLLRKEKTSNRIRDHLIETFNEIDKFELKSDKDSGKLLDILNVHPIEHVLFPKKEPFDYRRCALMQPMDTLKYTALVLSMAQEIEKKRSPKSQNLVHSYRLMLRDNNGYLFDKDFNYTSFEKLVRERIKEEGIKILVKCDISNFYDRLNLHRLESNLHSYNIEKKRIKLLNELLLFWAKRDSYGLPVGGNASRILAEASLIEVDKYLISHKIDFCRFVDDYRIFAKDAKQAHYWTQILIERLSQEGLSINQSKTKFQDVSLKIEKSSKELDAENRTNLVPHVQSNARRQIVAGYSGTIPTKFRESTASEQTKIKESSGEEIKEIIKNSIVVKPGEFKDFCKYIVYNEEWEEFKLFPSYLEKFPQFTPYLVDVLVKYEEKIDSRIKNQLKNEFAIWLIDEHYLPEYMCVAFVRLLSSKGYESAEILLNYYRSLKKNAGAYIGRAILEGLEGLVERGTALELRQFYSRADLWEKRQIIKIADRKLMQAEKAAWFKNIRMNEKNELFSIEAISQKEN